MQRSYLPTGQSHIHVSTYQFINLSIKSSHYPVRRPLSTHQSIHLIQPLFSHPSTYQSIHSIEQLSSHPSTCPLINLSIQSSRYSVNHPPIRSSTCPFNPVVIQSPSPPIHSSTYPSNPVTHPSIHSSSSPSSPAPNSTGRSSVCPYLYVFGVFEFGRHPLVVAPLFAQRHQTIQFVQVPVVLS